MHQLVFEDLPVINGERITLRPITDEDTEDIVRWRNDREVWQYFIFREPFTAELHRSWLRDKVYPGKVIQYMIIDRKSGKSVGSVYFRDIDPAAGSAEYGMFIGEADARSRGVGSEAAKLFSEFGLNVLHLHRISLRILSGNEASVRSCENAGFVIEGVFRDMVRLDGCYTDVIFMAMLNGDE